MVRMHPDDEAEPTLKQGRAHARDIQDDLARRLRLFEQKKKVFRPG
jgi:hypothetical protein